MAEPAPSGATVQLVRRADDAGRRTARLGLGLLVSLVVGWPALGAALAGGDGFEAAVIRFLLGVAVSVAGVLALGSLYDHFTAGPAGAATTHDRIGAPPSGEEDQP